MKTIRLVIVCGLVCLSLWAQATSFFPQYYTLSDDVSMIRGSHQFAFGYSTFKYQQSQNSNVFSTVNFGFTGIDSGLGMSGRSNIPGPGFFQIDSALSRIFRVQEKKTVELRVEAFNLTNSFRAGGSGATLVTTARNSPQFGQILNAQDPRIMQLALKFAF